MPRLIFKGDTNETFGMFLPTPIIDSIVIELVEPDDPFISSMGRINDLLGFGAGIPDSTELTKYTINTSIFFNTDDNFDVRPLMSEIFNTTPGIVTGLPGSATVTDVDESLYINIFVVNNKKNADDLKQNKMRLKDLCSGLVRADILQDAAGSAATDLGITNSDFDIFESVLTGKDQILSVPLSDFVDTLELTTDYDEDGNPIMKSGHVSLTGYIKNFTSIKNVTMFAAISTRSIADILNLSDAQFAINFSDVTYEDVVVDNNLAKFSDPVFVDVNNQFYPNTPLQALNTKFYKTEEFGHKDIIAILKNLTDEYKLPALTDDLLSQAIDGIDYVISVYGNSTEFLPRLNRYKELFPSKSAANPTGRLYDRFRTVILNSNITAIAQEEVVKRIFRNYKIIDARTTNFDDITSVSFNELLKDDDFAYPVAIESNVAKYVPVASSPLDYPGAPEIDSEEIYGARDAFNSSLDAFATEIRDLASTYFSGYTLGATGFRSLARTIARELADFADAYALNFVDDDRGWRVYVKAPNKATAKEIVNRDGFGDVLADFTIEAGGIGPGHPDEIGTGATTSTVDGDRHYPAAFYDSGIGLRNAGSKQLESLKSLMHRNDQLSLIVPKRSSTGGARGIGTTEDIRSLGFTSGASVDDFDIRKSMADAGDDSDDYDDINTLINKIQDNVGSIDLFQYTNVITDGVDLDRPAAIFLVKKLYSQIYEEIEELVLAAFGATGDLDDDTTTTVLDDTIQNVVTSGIETFIDTVRTEATGIYYNPTTSPLAGMTTSEEIASWIRSRRALVNIIREIFFDRFAVESGLQFYLAQKFLMAYTTDPDDDFEYMVMCQPEFGPYIFDGESSENTGIVYGSWSKLQGHIADGGLAREDRYAQVNAAAGLTELYSSFESEVADAISEFYTTAFSEPFAEYDAGGLSVLEDIDIVVKKSGYFFYDMEKFIRKNSFISKYVNVDRMLRTVDLAHEMLNNGVQMKDVTYANLTFKTNIMLYSPAATDYEAASDPTNFSGMFFDNESFPGSEGKVYKSVRPLQGGFRYNNFFDATFLDDTTSEVGDISIERVISRYGISNEYSYLAMRNYNFTNFKDSALFGTQTWRDNYRLMMFYYQIFIDDDEFVLSDIHKSDTGLRYTIDDSTYRVLLAIVDKYLDLFDFFITEYVEPAMQQCSYDEFNSKFNSFFVDGILGDFPDERGQPWYQMVAIHAIYVNMFTDLFNGDYNTMLDSANSILDQIKPQTGTLEALLDFKEQTDRFQVFLSDVRARAVADAAETLISGVDTVQHFSGNFTVESTVADFIGDFTDVLDEDV